MPKYAHVENGVVIGVYELKSAVVRQDYILCGDVSLGDQWTGTEFIPATPTALPLLTVQNGTVSISGLSAEPFNAMYFTESGAQIQLTGELHDADGQLADISIPVTLKMPFVRHANGQPTDDEVYLDVTLQNGVITSSGVIPRSGDWKVLTERNNAALAAVGASFRLQADNITFLA